MEIQKGVVRLSAAILKTMVRQFLKLLLLFFYFGELVVKHLLTERGGVRLPHSSRKGKILEAMMVLLMLLIRVSSAAENSPTGAQQLRPNVLPCIFRCRSMKDSCMSRCKKFIDGINECRRRCESQESACDEKCKD